MPRQFRTGDIVRVIGNFSIPGQFTVGQIYTVSGIRGYDGDDYYTVMIEEDDSGSRTNGWGHDYFELVAEAPPEVAPPPVPMQEIVTYLTYYKWDDEQEIAVCVHKTEADTIRFTEYLQSTDHLTFIANKKIKTNIPVVEN